ncbi:hypothetical protein M9Y10_032580 [Tritrichomonas musculus]|uniref:Ubiquitin-like domain-containing protein n=1 Tax=Tritrichomonas musculus TaxID=1915356 RepID=A0ABR2GYT6_9EUKA
MSEKRFYYKVHDPNFSRSIKVDINQCKTISDLKNQIALDLHTIDSIIKINDDYGEKQLSKMPENYEFTILIVHRCFNIFFIFPDGYRINIQNSYKMNFGEVIDEFKKSNLYYSNSCQKLLQFKVSNIEVPQIQYPFLAVPVLKSVYVTTSCPVVILKYGSNKFIFSENESVSEALSVIKNAYLSCSYVSIVGQNNRKINFWEKLQKFEKYQVNVYYQIPFRSLDENLFFTKKIDFLATIGDVKQLIALECEKNDLQVNPESINVYNSSRTIIRDTRKQLKSVQNLFKIFYFEYDIEKVNSNKSIEKVETFLPPREKKMIYKFPSKMRPIERFNTPIVHSKGPERNQIQRATYAFSPVPLYRHRVSLPARSRDMQNGAAEKIYQLISSSSSSSSSSDDDDDDDELSEDSDSYNLSDTEESRTHHSKEKKQSHDRKKHEVQSSSRHSQKDGDNDSKHSKKKKEKKMSSDRKSSSSKRKESSAKASSGANKIDDSEHKRSFKEKTSSSNSNRPTKSNDQRVISDDFIDEYNNTEISDSFGIDFKVANNKEQKNYDKAILSPYQGLMKSDSISNQLLELAEVENDATSSNKSKAKSSPRNALSQTPKKRIEKISQTPKSKKQLKREIKEDSNKAASDKKEQDQVNTSNTFMNENE